MVRTLITFVVSLSLGVANANAKTEAKQKALDIKADLRILVTPPEFVGVPSWSCPKPFFYSDYASKGRHKKIKSTCFE